VPITISADDPRTIRAIQIAAEAGHWLACRTARGEDAFRVPSQSQRDRYYLVTPSSCDCPDFRRDDPTTDDDRACKHMLAVRLYAELVRAQQYLSRTTPERTRAHLWVVPRNETGT
jgi:hypothetical protein